MRMMITRRGKKMRMMRSRKIMGRMKGVIMDKE